MHKVTLCEIKTQGANNTETFNATEFVAQVDVDTVCKIKHFSEYRFDKLTTKFRQH
ncbi:hypothetical protein NTGM5_60012 [Candidatus Nitrotoga sp. M5]|nr:hypothetical protein NTGM5_60012 [Candidatus Nitrotoga sp. M5]